MDNRGHNLTMQKGFTKLFNTIVTSTIWSEDDKTRIIWITMLAICDRYGDVAASIPGLAKVANVSVEDTEKALKNLMAPDTYSRTQEHDGRRIEEVDGGWHIYTYEKHREMLSAEERKEYKARKERERRARIKQNVDKSGQKLPAVEPDGQSGHSTEADSRGKISTPSMKVYIARPKGPSSVLDFFVENKSTTAEASKFFDHYTSNGWKVGGKAPMKDWQAAARNWIRNSAQQNFKSKPKEPAPAGLAYQPLPPKREPTDEEIEHAKQIAQENVAKLKQQFRHE